jgi:uncharacterized protein involved in exopolysaccharide biosynthesis
VDPREENIVELGSRMEEMKSQHEKEMRELEEKHKFACLRFENFIERLEKRKQELTREIQKLTGKLKTIRSQQCPPSNLRIMSSELKTYAYSIDLKINYKCPC